MMPNKHLIVSLHDLHPGSLDIVSRQIDFCQSKGVHRFSILAMPHYHHQKKLEDDERTLNWLSERAKTGDDIVLHGYYHDRQNRKGGSLFYTKFYTANEAEFLDLSDDEARLQILEGMKIWKNQGWPLNGFIAPAWLFPETQDHILKELGFTYTTRLKGIYNLQKNTYIPTQSLCYSTRAAWRIAASLLWNRHLFNQLKNTPIIRLGLHPSDFAHPSVMKQIGEILETALENGFKPISYSDIFSHTNNAC